MHAQYLTPAVTVFDGRGKIDPDGNRRVYDHLISGGIDGIVIMGSTGEFSGMTMAQQKELITLAVPHIRGRARLLVGASRLLAEETVELSNYAHGRGADGVMIVSPFYFALPDASVEAYYDAVASATPARIYLYNFPDRTGYSISPQVTANLLRKHKNIVGFKDTVTDMGHTLEVIKCVKPEFPDFEVYSGFDNNFINNLNAGGAGCIGALPNLVPRTCSAWARAYDARDEAGIAAGQQLVDALMELYAVSVPFIPAMKRAMNLLGLGISERCTQPILPVDDEQDQRIRRILEKIPVR